MILAIDSFLFRTILSQQQIQFYFERPPLIRFRFSGITAGVAEVTQISSMLHTALRQEVEDKFDEQKFRVLKLARCEEKAVLQPYKMKILGQNVGLEI